MSQWILMSPVNDLLPLTSLAYTEESQQLCLATLWPSYQYVLDAFVQMVGPLNAPME
jgi:hypothetical protein